MDAHDALPILCLWTLSHQDMNGRPINWTFDLTHGDSPLRIGLNIQQFSSHSFTNSKPKIHIKLANACDGIILPAFISDGNTLQLRGFVDLIGVKSVPSVYNFLATQFSHTKRINDTAKRLHRYSHAPMTEMMNFMKRAGFEHNQCEQVHDNIVEACLV